MKDQDGFWIKMMLKAYCISRMVLIIKLFLQMFWEKILIFFEITLEYYSQLNESITSCFYKAHGIS